MVLHVFYYTFTFYTLSWILEEKGKKKVMIVNIFFRFQIGVVCLLIQIDTIKLILYLVWTSSQLNVIK